MRRPWATILAAASRLAAAARVRGSSAALAARRRVPRRRAHAVIVTPSRSTVMHRDGAVRSVQSAILTLDAADLERLWVAPNLENLARTYWRFLSRVTLGLVRVRYTADTRAVVLLWRRLTLLRFEAPRYTLDRDRGSVRWLIRDGLLVARGRHRTGFLALDVRRRAAPDPRSRETVLIEVEVANFYPSIAARFSAPVYELTQAVVHVSVTHAFLRSLARLDLARSKVGRLAGLTAAPELRNASGPSEPR